MSDRPTMSSARRSSSQAQPEPKKTGRGCSVFGLSPIVVFGGAFLLVCFFGAILAVLSGPPGETNRSHTPRPTHAPAPTLEAPRPRSAAPGGQSQGSGQAWVKESAFACETKELIDDMMDFVAANDRASAAAYIQRGACTIVKPSIPVTVTNHGFMYSEVAFSGAKVWVQTDMIEYR